MLANNSYSSTGAEMYLEEPLQHYLEDLASSKSAPGGGSAAALSGAMGAALASMVARLTLGKAEYSDVQQEIGELLQQTEKLRTRFQQLMQEDIEAYGRLSVCFKMPRDTDEQRGARSVAIQASLVDAALVPLEVAERSAELVQCCRRIAEIGNSQILSDIGTGSMLASSAGAGAGWIVRINLRAMQDLELAQVLSDRLSRALETISTTSEQITAIVGSRA
jgi:formiminotetrahydrofolate cyclodeaminase